MEYELEELVPVLAELAEKFTSKESTSVSYERARQLMEAVQYCISQCERSGQIVSAKGVSAREAYQWGYENLIEKVKTAQKHYNEMMLGFCAYGNENYQLTVEKAISGFFIYYDPRFAPQENLITMDYPTICPITDECGINAVAKYIDYISLEQEFLNALPRSYVYGILHQFQPDYQKQFFNICSIILRHILGHMMIEKKLGEESSEEDYELLKKRILEDDPQHLEKLLEEYLFRLIQEKYNADQSLESYLSHDLKNFAVEMYAAAENDSLRYVVVL